MDDGGGDGDSDPGDVGIQRVAARAENLIFPGRSLQLRTISVLIPTWRRPDELANCLEALREQIVPADQIVIAARQDDHPTHHKLKALRLSGNLPAGVEVVMVGAVPLTESMNMGLQRTTGDLVALTDDDAVPWRDWLSRCQSYFEDPDIGGVGGRDWQPHERQAVHRVGKVSWYGRITGNHHRGTGPARDVDILKGVNACFRGDVLRSIGFDRRLRGRANVTHWELSLCLALRRRGWRLVYDPVIGVEHRPAMRHDGDVNTRGGFELISHSDGVYNESLALLDHLGAASRVAWLAWSTLVGTIGTPGPIQAVRRWFKLRETPGLIVSRMRSSWDGRFAALADWNLCRRRSKSQLEVDAT
jgi:GT2 family glycosyltransferase